ncbi:unnamed protein product [Mytilus coruscus]|uniref:Uncharacterized protein n=1 Tax=Mytilus coruscus TaxID=42192 RepID=A0A6J8AEE9_MYTCO|nr:unnamed protein product [Mytilus coruscus]
MILKKLMEKYDKNIDEISKDLPKVLEATLRCYDGDCTLCPEYSIVCKGDAALNWWIHSLYLSTYQITALQMDKTDKFLLQEILKMKLTSAAIERVDLSERSKLHLKKMDTDFKYNQDYILRPAVQERRLKQNAERLAEHKTWRELNKKHDYYCKGQLDPQPALQFQDHDSYCKPKLPRPAAD